MAIRAALIGSILGLSLAGRAAAAPPIDTVPLLLTSLALDLRVDYSHATLGGTATLELRNLADHRIRQIPLLLNRLMTVSRVTAADGRAIPFTQRTVLFLDDSALQVNAISVTPTTRTRLPSQWSGPLPGPLVARPHESRSDSLPELRSSRIKWSRWAASESGRIFQDWFLTTRWYARLRTGESVEQVVESYRRPGN